MNIKISPSKLKGTITAPSSKSMGHRLLICAGLAEGESQIDNLLFSEDILATLDCLATLGAEIKTGEASVSLKGTLPSGGDGKKIFPCRESGSTLRFFIPMAMLCQGESLFTGYGRLMERPMSVYENIAKEKNLTYIKSNDGITVAGGLSGGSFTLPGDISSQFISGLLFALPICEDDSEIVLTGNIESRSYIDMTIYAMSLFGVTAEWQNENTIYIKGAQKYKSRNLTVEGDYSNAAFLEAFNYLGSDINVEGLSKDSLQGDKIYREYFSLLRQGTPTLDIKNCPDLAPILMTLAAANNGCRLINTARLRIKESDRGAVMAEELAKFGAVIRVRDNEITVGKTPLHPPSKALISHNDHRVVMALAVLMSVFGGEIKNAEAVRKSYPDFFERVKALGLEVTENDD